VSMAQTAASIEYEAAPTPADLPDDMQPLAGTSLRFLSIKAIDGFKVRAALWQPENKPPAETTIIVGVHGSGGNLASLPLRATARGLSTKGYAALSISTRQHDCHIHPIAEDVVFLDDHVAEIDPDTELCLPFHRDIGVALDHPPLHLDRVAHRIDDTRELDQHPVAGILYGTAPVLLDLWIDQFPEMFCEAFVRPSSSAPISRE
jgi:hypothetical protein